MTAGLVLVGFGALLIIVPLLLAYRTVPGLKAQGSGVGIELQGQASRDLPRTPAVLRNVIVGVLVVMGLSTGGIGLKLVVDEAAVSNAERLSRLQQTNNDRLRDLAVIVATPLSARTPVPGRTPIPAAPAVPAGVFQEAVRADADGDRDEAIQLYQQAINAGLPQPYLSASLLQMGVLDLMIIEDGVDDPRERAARCTRAQRNLSSAESSTQDSRTRDLARQALEQHSRLCGAAA